MFFLQILCRVFITIPSNEVLFSVSPSAVLEMYQKMLSSDELIGMLMISSLILGSRAAHANIQNFLMWAYGLGFKDGDLFSVEDILYVD